MDIAALSIIKNQAQLKQGVGIAVLKKAMGTAEHSSTLINQMLDKVNDGNTVTRAKLPYLGNHVDRLV